MHHSRLAAVVIDCRTDDLKREAGFWSGALGRAVVAPKTAEGEGRYLDLEEVAGQPQVLLQRVDHDSRVHLDIETDDVAAEVRRLETLGAKRVAQVRTWWVMEAPGGQRFCVVEPQRSDFPQGANTWP
ncbi:VOC family protein [Pelagibius sp. CAU 1746]|uniref:VOC family protein n=1 Tax=Pelagibius sp. CAU 1746 TaxID=3140370 RepID=UPI00325BAC9A